MTCGIYKLSFDGTSKVYVGLSLDVERRYRAHKSSLAQCLSDSKLQEAYNTFGKPTLEVLCECAKEDLDKYEIEAIEIYDSIANGFNTRKGGTTGSTNAVGEVNSMALYNKQKYIDVFNDLVDTNKSYNEIAYTHQVSLQIVTHIAVGNSHSGWLRECFPERYQSLISKRFTRQLKKITIVNIETNEEVSGDSLIVLSSITRIPKSSLSALNTGKIKTTHGYRLKVPRSYIGNPKTSYAIYKDGILHEVVNISKFCRDNGIPNRKIFTKFLKGATSEKYYGFSHK